MSHTCASLTGNASVMSRSRLGDSGPEVLTVMFRDRIYLDPNEITLTLAMSGTANRHKNYIHV